MKQRVQNIVVKTDISRPDPVSVSLILSARYVLPVTSPIIKDGAVYVSNGVIKDIDKLSRLVKRYKIDVIELGRGILMPGFINGHVHLELGAMQAKLDPKDDFPSWILEIIRERLTLSRKKASEAIETGINTLLNSGVVGVGEISSLGIDKQYLQNSHLYTVLFKEVMSYRKLIKETYSASPYMEERPFAHAPYSTSSEVYIELSKRFDSYGTHISESIDENKLVIGEQNNFIKRLSPLVRRKPLMKMSRSPVDYISKLGFLNKKATLVHCVHIDKQDFYTISHQDAGIILCPRSNAYLGVGLPNIELLYNYPRLGLGTDGLSSNYSLDMMDEIRFLYLIARPILKSKAESFVINTATIGGARALFIEDKLGSIDIGKLAGLIYLDIDVAKNIYLSIINTPSSAIKNLVWKLL
jgi:cytosine/adenosine deaminase-related metal-dependent hydrolase